MIEENIVTKVLANEVLKDECKKLARQVNSNTIGDSTNHYIISGIDLILVGCAPMRYFASLK